MRTSWLEPGPDPELMGSHAKALRTWTESDERRLRFYTQFVKPGDLVFDVGANVGTRTKVFLRLGASVVGFEPQRACADVLRQVLGSNPSFHLVQEAVGAAPGRARLLVSDRHVLSTLSETWLTKVRQSGRFAGARWKTGYQVTVTTLDAAVARFGVPAFVKVDVEGFEAEVLAGLSQPVRAGSIEFAAEALETTFWCIDRLVGLADYRFQLSLEESMSFCLPDWQGAPELTSALDLARSGNPFVWGDVYFAHAPPRPNAVAGPV